MANQISYAANVRRQALLGEIEHLRPLLPDTEATKRNVAAIEKHRPLAKMSEEELSTYLNLFARSI